MKDMYEGRTADADISAAVKIAVSEAAKEYGPGFSWDLVKIDGSHGSVPFEVGVTIKVK